MTAYDSSAPVLAVVPSSGALRSLRHDENIVSVGPGLAKGTSGSRVCVQCSVNFRTARLALGWSQGEAAERLGCTRKHVINIEHARAALSDELLSFTAWIVEQAEARARTGT